MGGRGGGKDEERGGSKDIEEGKAKEKREGQRIRRIKRAKEIAWKIKKRE